MLLIKIKQNYQITLPNSLRKYLNIAVGDYMEVEKHDGELVLKPVKMVHPEQVYFYTKEWQKDETEADKDIAAGNMIGPFETIEDFAKAMKK